MFSQKHTPAICTSPSTTLMRLFRLGFEDDPWEVVTSKTIRPLPMDMCFEDSGKESCGQPSQNWLFFHFPRTWSAACCQDSLHDKIWPWSQERCISGFRASQCRYRCPATTTEESQTKWMPCPGIRKVGGIFSSLDRSPLNHWIAGDLLCYEEGNIIVLGWNTEHGVSFRRVSLLGFSLIGRY